MKTFRVEGKLKKRPFAVHRSGFGSKASASKFAKSISRSAPNVLICVYDDSEFVRRYRTVRRRSSRRVACFRNGRQRR